MTPFDRVSSPVIGDRVSSRPRRGRIFHLEVAVVVMTLRIIVVCSAIFSLVNSFGARTCRGSARGGNERVIAWQVMDVAPGEMKEFTIRIFN